MKIAVIGAGALGGNFKERRFSIADRLRRRFQTAVP
jgi:hypothetical protein